MRTTVTLDPDVAAAVEQLRRDKRLGFSEALNQLARLGLAAKPKRRRFVTKTHDLGFRIDVTNVGEVLSLLDEEDQD
jgi:hypothetical protein